MQLPVRLEIYEQIRHAWRYWF